MNNYIWLLGENDSATANNNSYYFWKQIVNKNDEIDKYIVLKKNKQNKEVYKSLSENERKFVLWKNSIKHYKMYFNADMFFVTLSYKDVMPTKLFGKSIKLKIKKPIVYLQHGTMGIKKIGYTGKSYNNNMFKFCIYNNKIRETFKQKNDFKDYQLYNAEFHPRYMELIKRDEKYKEKKQILYFLTWREYFGKNIETELFIRNIKKLVSSKKLKEYLEKNDIQLKICVHAFFDNDILKDVYPAIVSDKISIIIQQSTDIMDELAKSKLLITDYSSVGFDFTFLNKPVILFEPDRDNYLEKREIYCTEEELEENSIRSIKELIDKIINEKYEINKFFRERLPQHINYNYIKSGKHIEKMYNDFSRIQKNKITFMGYNFYGVGGTVNATRALAEGLLERGYLVELLSLKRTKNPTNMPYGLNITSIVFGKTKSLREKIIRNLHRSKKNYSYLKYDANVKLLHPYCGYKLTKMMKNIHTNTLISTRESLHLFLNDCSSEKVKQKIYFFHCPNENVEVLFPGVMDKIKEKRIHKAIFVTEKNRQAFKEQHKYDNYDEYAVIGNALEQYKIVNIDEIQPVEKKKLYRGIYLLRISKDRVDDLNNLINFGVFLKNKNIKNFILDVYGTGDYVEQFLDELEDKDIMDVINYRGLTTNPTEVLRNHDMMVDLSLNHSFGMTYIEAILNGKKVFCMKNPGSLEVMENIPNSYIESFDWLYEKINQIHTVSREELIENYKKIDEKYSRKVVTDKFINFLEEK